MTEWDPFVIKMSLGQLGTQERGVKLRWLSYVYKYLLAGNFKYSQVTEHQVGGLLACGWGRFFVLFLIYFRLLSNSVLQNKKLYCVEEKKKK